MQQPGHFDGWMLAPLSALEEARLCPGLALSGAPKVNIRAYYLFNEIHSKLHSTMVLFNIGKCGHA